MTTYAVYAVNELGGGTDQQLEKIGPFSYSRVLNGVGTFTGTVPLGLYDVTIGKRGIVVVRDATVVWWGPVTDLDRDEFTRQVTITAMEASWHLGVRVMEADTTWSDQPVDIASSIASTGIAKPTDVLGTPYGGPLAGFTAAVVGVPAAAVKSWTYAGNDRYYALQTIDDLATNDPDGFFYRMTYSGSIGTRARVLQLGEGTALQTTTLTVDPAGGLTGFKQRQSLGESANRLHGMSSGATPIVLQNDASLTDGDFLMERVYSQSTVGPNTPIADWLRRKRSIYEPPANVVSIGYRHQDTKMEYGDCLPGGRAEWRLEAAGGFATAGAYDGRRVGQMTVTVDSGESVALDCIES